MFGFTADCRAARVRQREESPVLGSGGVMLGVPWRVAGGSASGESSQTLGILERESPEHLGTACEI